MCHPLPTGLDYLLQLLATTDDDSSEKLAMATALDSGFLKQFCSKVLQLDAGPHLTALADESAPSLYASYESENVFSNIPKNVQNARVILKNIQL